MKKDLAVIFGLAFLIIVLIIFGRGFTTLSLLSQQPLEGGQKSSKESIEVHAKTLLIKAKVADVASERKTGLSKMESLSLGEGMLFVFESEAPYAIWMKDMKFAIDIIWINKNKTIVDIAQNVAPEPGKKDKELTIYRPGGNALYVLEVNAGLSSLHDLQIGDAVDFEL